MQITRSLPLLDEILVPWQECLGADYVGYRNHLYRLLHYCFYLGMCRQGRIGEADHSRGVS